MVETSQIHTPNSHFFWETAPPSSKLSLLCKITNINAYKKVESVHFITKQKKNTTVVLYHYCMQ